jgi:Transcription factor WhiB
MNESVERYSPSPHNQEPVTPADVAMTMGVVAVTLGLGDELSVAFSNDPAAKEAQDLIIASIDLCEGAGIDPVKMGKVSQFLSNGGFSRLVVIDQPAGSDNDDGRPKLYLAYSQPTSQTPPPGKEPAPTPAAKEPTAKDQALKGILLLGVTDDRPLQSDVALELRLKFSNLSRTAAFLNLPGEQQKILRGLVGSASKPPERPTSLWRGDPAVLQSAVDFFVGYVMTGKPPPVAPPPAQEVVFRPRDVGLNEYNQSHSAGTVTYSPGFTSLKPNSNTTPAESSVGDTVRGMGKERWREVAACREMDTESFYPAPKESAEYPLTICFSCDVRSQCLAYALERGETHGVWGGKTEEERLALSHKKRK